VRLSCDADRGFTLIEVIVVVAISGALMAIAIPAVQAAREMARRMQCQSHLRQIGLGCCSHEASQRHFPSGGWGWGWQGDPDRGYAMAQPGGWVYNLLPFVEETQLRLRGKGADLSTKRVEGQAVAATPLSLFNCPTRRNADAYPFVCSQNFFNIERPNAVGHTDYAANAGDMDPGQYYGSGPESLTQAGSYKWTQMDRTGLVFQRSTIRAKQVTDGLSMTYLVGEGYLDSTHYLDGLGSNDDQGMYVGYDRDTLRVTHWAYPPLMDRANFLSNHSFGSAHNGGFNMAFCDGSVHFIQYEIDPFVHRALGNRSDGVVVDISDL
jgi:prepilin-type N-terminal cleavage/methylation domain-containing protein/prepilin-type processing-associated H-X9-DG protein